MADNDILLRVGIDTTPAERDLNEFQAKLRGLQQQAATTQTPTGGPSRIAQLPAAAQRQLFDTTPVNKDATTELSKQQQAQKRLIDQRARLIALAQAEARVVAQAGGGTASKTDLGRIRAGAESALAKSLGLDTLTPAIKGQITKTINSLEAQFSTALAGLSGTQLQNRFRQVANPVLQQVGVTEPVRVRQAATVVREAEVAENRAAQQRQAAAEEREARANEQSAAVAESDAADSARSAQNVKASRRRQERAAAKKAAAEERAVIQLTKFAAEEVQGLLDIETDEGRTPWGTLEGRNLRVNDSARATDALRYRSETIVDAAEGQLTNEEMVGARSKARALERVADLVELQATNEAQALAEQERQQALQSNADTQITAAMEAEADAALRNARQEANAKAAVESARRQEIMDHLRAKAEENNRKFGPPRDDEVTPFDNKTYGEMRQVWDLEAEMKPAILRRLNEMPLPDLERMFGTLDVPNIISKYQDGFYSSDDLFNKAAQTNDIANMSRMSEIISASENEVLAARELADEQFRAAAQAVAEDQKQQAADAQTTAAKQQEAVVAQQQVTNEAESAAQKEAAQQAQAAAEAAAVEAKQREAAEAAKQVEIERENTALLARLRDQVARGLITAEQGNRRLAQAGMLVGRTTSGGGFESERTVLNGEEDRRLRREAEIPRQAVIPDDDVPAFEAAEQALIQSLIAKRTALDAQTAVITSNLGEFRGAEEALIAALLGKANALRSQTAATQQTPVAESTRATRERVARRDEVISEPAPKKERTGPRPLGEEDGLDWDESTVERNEAAIREDTQELNEHSALVQRLSNAVRQGIISQEEANARIRSGGPLLSEGGRGFVTDAERRILNADLDRQRDAERQARLAMERANMPLSRRFGAPTKQIAVGALSGLSDFQEELSNLDKIIPTEQMWDNLRNRPKMDNIEDFDPDFDQVQQANAVLAQATRRASISLTLFSETMDDQSVLIAQELARMRAITAAFNQRLAGMTTMNIVDDPILQGEYTRGAAERRVGQRILDVGTEQEIARDPNLQRRLIQADLELMGLRQAQAAQIAQEIAQNPERLRANVEATLVRQRAALAERQLGQSLGALDIATERRILSMRESVTANERVLSTKEGRDLVRRQEDVRRRRRDIITGVDSQPEGFVGKITRKLGYQRTGGDNLAQFFGGGALASLRYGLPSMLLYGAATGIGDTIREAEELQYNLARLEGQFNATFGGSGDFDRVRGNILDIAKKTGLAADEIANLQIQITGAFGQANVAADFGFNDPQEFVETQVESAAKLAQTIGLPLEEITDGLTAASLAFDATFEEIGDVALALEEQSGVLARETVSFIGDIAPVAEEAGYGLEEFAAMAAVAQQRSGRSGAALAESFGRVIPAITEQKDKLMELAALDPGLATDQFFDAIRTSDAGAILEQIGRSYANMTTEAQQATVALLGGRREAQALIPALVNRGLIDEYTRSAEEGAGTLEERFLKVQETLTNAMQRLGESIRQFGVVLLEAGLTETFETLIDLAKFLLGALTPIVGVLGSMNTILGGMPGAMLLFVGASKLLNRTLLTRQPLDPSTGLPLIDPTTQRPVAREPRFQRNLNRPTVYEPSYFRNNLSRQVYGPYGSNIGQIPTRNLMRNAGIGGTLRAGGTSLLQGLGGGSALFGAGFVGVTALTSLYGWANNQADKERANLEELKAEIDQGNAAVDLDIPEIRESRVEELRAQAEDAREAYGGWSEFWGKLFGIMSQEEALLAEAAALDAPKEFLEAEEVLGQSTSLRQDLFDRFGVKLGKRTGALRNVFETFNAYEDAYIREIEGVLEVGAVDEEGKDVGGTTRLDQNDVRYLTDLAELTGIDVKDLDLGFVQASLEGDQGKQLFDLATNQGDAAEKYGAEAVEQAQRYIAALYGLAPDDPELENRINELRGLVDALPPVEESKLKVDELQGAFEAGLITSGQYLDRLEEEVRNQFQLLTIGEETEANESQILNAYQKIQQARQAQVEAIQGRQETQREIATLLHGEEAGDLLVYSQNLENLENPRFSDPEARVQAAMDLIEAKKNLDLQVAMESGNLAEVQRLYTEGSEIPASARATLFRASLQATDDDFEQFIVDFNSVKLDIISRVDNLKPGEFGISADPRIVDQSRDALREMFDVDAETLAEDLFADIFDDGILSGDMSNTLNDMLSAAVANAENPDLTPEQRLQYENAIAFIVAMMNYAGMGAAAIAEGIGNNPVLPQSEIQGIINDNPIVGDFERFAEIEEEERSNEILDAEMELRRARANRDAVAIARINREAADWQMLAAQAEPDALKRAAAIKQAEAAQIEADHELIEATKTINDAKRAYAIGMAELAGDFVGAAQLEVEQARADYADAIAAKDDAGAFDAMLAEAQALDRVREESLADRTSGLELERSRLEGSGDLVGAQRKAIEIAREARNAAQGTREINETQQALEEAERAMRDALIEESNALYDVFIAALEFEGDTMGAARLRIQQADQAMRNARSPVERAQARQQQLQAWQQAIDLHRQQRDTTYNLFRAGTEDPIVQAQLDVQRANEMLSLARGQAQEFEAMQQVIEANRNLASAMADARMAQYELRQAELQAMGDEIGAARVAQEMARLQLQEAINRGAGPAEIARNRAAVINADAQARDTILNERMDEYKWLLDMGKITQSQYINYLEGLKSTLIPGTKQFRDLELTIKQLKEDISGDLEMNLPTSLRLPTLYEVRRLEGTAAGASGGGTSIGYQDQRVQNVQVMITKDMSESQVLSVLSDALGAGRSGFGPRRY